MPFLHNNYLNCNAQDNFMIRQNNFLTNLTDPKLNVIELIINAMSTR